MNSIYVNVMKIYWIFTVGIIMKKLIIIMKIYCILNGIFFIFHWKFLDWLKFIKYSKYMKNNKSLSIRNNTKRGNYWQTKILIWWIFYLNFGECWFFHSKKGVHSLILKNSVFSYCRGMIWWNQVEDTAYCLLTVPPVVL